MRIRTITYFCHPGRLEFAARFLESARQTYQAAGYEVQSLRLAFPPFTEWMPSLDPHHAVNQALQLERVSQQAGIGYISIGPALPEDEPAQAALMPILAATQSAFCSGLMGNARRGVYLPAVRACARVIAGASTLSPDGFTNLRFAAMANVPPGSPFFPAAYAPGQESFAIGVEGAGLAVEAFHEASSLDNACRSLVEAVETQAKRLSQVGSALQSGHQVQFGGIDFSLAPFPETLLSLGTALESLGVPAAGSAGSLAAAALITSCLDQAQFPRAGFCGLFLPVLEDSTLALRAASGSLGIKDLLMLSAVCGTGLDTIPLPGDSSPGQIAALLLDLAALACRLDKPLTARLMPVPGRQAGDETNFDFAFFSNSRVMNMQAQELTGLLTGDGWLPVVPRRIRE